MCANENAACGGSCKFFRDFLTGGDGTAYNGWGEVDLYEEIDAFFAGAAVDDLFGLH